MRKTLLFLLLICTLFSCTKEGDKKYCWQGFDPAGYALQGLLVCDKTLAEVEASYPQYWFYKSDEPTFCWLVQPPLASRYYMRHIPESMVEKMKPYGVYTYSKIDCNSFCRWQWYEKAKHKGTGLYSPTRAGIEVYLADSCGKLFSGRMIVVRETIDSIYTREFVKQDP